MMPSAAYIAGFVACPPISSSSTMKFITHPFQVPVNFKLHSCYRG